ncbi:hypothetical protein V8J82_11825 [Gymnodinialimonas sp. 2305UL16-5]|uniref:hypothetical protein n=1 Tax=Gymnodinialimonas mytili TaxID=3126503 RepID=UPI003096E4E9
MKRRRGLSIICISAMVPSLALAQSFPAGCFVRDYSAEHLAEHPEQGVAEIRMLFDENDLSLTIAAVMGETGQAVRDDVAGRHLTERALCDRNGRCAILCDGGDLWLHRDEGASILMRTDGARIATEPCRTDLPSSDLAEAPNAVTTYRLFRASEEACITNARPGVLLDP